jgi:glycine cleavage system H protein
MSRMTRKQDSELSRRAFLKEAILTVAGVSLTPLIFLASCNNSKTEGTTTNQTPTTQAITTQTPATPSENPTTSAPVTNTTTQTTNKISTTVANGLYIPPTTKPAMVSVPNCASKVATDRLYSKDHIWVKQLGSDKVVVGISDMLQLLVVPTDIELPQVGKWFLQGDTFGTLHGQKLIVDAICPVSGEILQVNTYLPLQANPEGIHSIVDDPYSGGWLAVIHLSKPEELKGLLTAEQYIAYSSKIESLG